MLIKEGEGKNTASVPNHCSSIRHGKLITDRQTELRTLAGLIKLNGNFASCWICNNFSTNNDQESVQAFYNPMLSKGVQRSAGQKMPIKINYMKLHENTLLTLTSNHTTEVDEIFKDTQITLHYFKLTFHLEV